MDLGHRVRGPAPDDGAAGPGAARQLRARQHRRRWNPVDADRYTHVSLRLYASQDQAFRVGWFTCSYDYTPCFSYHDFRVQQGWQTITLPMRQISGDWRGKLLGIRLASGAGSTDFKLDWFRIHTADSSPTPPAGAPQPQVLTPEPRRRRGRGRGGRRQRVGLPRRGRRGRGAQRPRRPLRGRAVRGHQRPAAAGQPVDPAAPRSRHRPVALPPADDLHDLRRSVLAGLRARWRHARALAVPARRQRPGLGGQPRAGHLPVPSDRHLRPQGRPLRFDRRARLPELDRVHHHRPAVGPQRGPGARTWRVDDIRLAAPHEASGLFDVQWRDRAHQPGTTVDIGVSAQARRHLDARRSPPASPNAPASTPLGWTCPASPRGSGGCGSVPPRPTG